MVGRRLGEMGRARPKHGEKEKKGFNGRAKPKGNNMATIRGNVARPLYQWATGGGDITPRRKEDVMNLESSATER